MSIEDILKEVIKICRQYQVEELILFGSRAKGTAQPRSDIDLAVAGMEDTEELTEAINEIPTLYSFDVVNLDTCKNTLLLEDIKKYGKKLL